MSKYTDPAATYSHYPERCIDSFGGCRNGLDGDGRFFAARRLPVRPCCLGHQGGDMNRIQLIAAWFSVGAVALASTGAGATTATIQSTDSVWNYASDVAGTGSTTPTEIALTPGAGQVLTFSSVTGMVNITDPIPSLNFGPDGGHGLAINMNISAAAGLSGIQSFNTSFLAGVFLNGQEGDIGHTAPATLNFTSNYNFTSLSPLDDQVFFIGDGLTGTGSGSVQVFNVPSDATFLVLGITDANGYNGPPGAYFDNAGSFTAVFSIEPTTTPLPSALPLLTTGLGAMGLFGWRRKRKARSRRRVRLPPMVVALILPLIAQLLFSASAARAGTFATNDFVSYGEGSYANDPTAELLLSDHFGDVYNGSPAFELTVGGTTPGSFYISFDGAAGVQTYLPSSGPPGALTGTMLDPTTTASGLFGGDVTALALDIDFNAKGYLGNSTTRFGDLVLTGFTGSLSGLDGMSVSGFLALSELALGGAATAYSYSDLDNVTSSISTAFYDGNAHDFATDHLDFPQVSNPQLPILSPTPLPSSILLFGSGIAGFGALRRRRRNSSKALPA